ncbi:hypothetical protein PILCRDRAFT_745506 [Piloderma croceum F 1598]|uniref:Uncharacterized protein n=1 Tax=Piloderma croceum (strain F 1598) TaxID=765440 RepID=A0A0C3EW02_PILCF|nr:hypothetical protein PILCRDRAFT_745506 [Piloderma croceum F 1598]
MVQIKATTTRHNIMQSDGRQDLFCRREHCSNGFVYKLSCNDISPRSTPHRPVSLILPNRQTSKWRSSKPRRKPKSNSSCSWILILSYVTHVNVQLITSKVCRCPYLSLSELMHVSIFKKGMWRWRVRVQAKCGIMFSRGRIVGAGI